MTGHPKWPTIHIKIEKYILKKISKFIQTTIPCVYLQNILDEAPSAAEATTFRWEVNSNIETALQNKGNNWYEVLDFVAKVASEND